MGFIFLKLHVQSAHLTLLTAIQMSNFQMM